MEDKPIVGQIGFKTVDKKCIDKGLIMDSSFQEIFYGMLDILGYSVFALLFVPHHIVACHLFHFCSQYMSLSKTGELRREEMCAEIPAYFSAASAKVHMVRCHGRRGNQEWYLSQASCAEYLLKRLFLFLSDIICFYTSGWSYRP